MNEREQGQGSGGVTQRVCACELKCEGCTLNTRYRGRGEELETAVVRVEDETEKQRETERRARGDILDVANPLRPLPGNLALQHSPCLHLLNLPLTSQPQRGLESSHTHRRTQTPRI